mmetsp:Transcript_21936/g.32306  ORF Transcript_21936/g.32306 Transcript_21936/m.32306 type:complete len:184 (-) Transcript_21936:265-816(-)|eukprot:10091905-Ditylum_brightwellii.AAC.1
MKLSIIFVQVPLLLTFLSLFLPTEATSKMTKQSKGTKDSHSKYSYGTKASAKGGKKGYYQVDPEFICDVLESFDKVGSDYFKTNRKGNYNERILKENRWRAVCSLFDTADEYVCPEEEALKDICSSTYKPHKNRAIKFDYCTPLFEDMIDAERQDECIRYCINYVSKERGDCCDFECSGSNNE